MLLVANRHDATSNALPISFHLSVVLGFWVVSQQAALAGGGCGEDGGVEVPVEVGGEVLGHFSAAVVDLQQIAGLIFRDVVAAAVPEVAAKDEDIAGVAEDWLQGVAVPVSIGLGGLSAGPMAAGDDLRRAQFPRLGAQVKVCRAEVDGDVDPGGNPRFGPLHGKVVDMQSQALMTGMTAPGRFTNDMAAGTEDRFRQIDHAGAIEKRQPEGVSIEDILVLVRQA